MNNKNIRKVAVWEFNKTLRSPLFIIMTFVIPLLIALVSSIPAIIDAGVMDEKRSIAVIDESGFYYPVLLHYLGEGNYNAELIGNDIPPTEALEGGGYDGVLLFEEQSMAEGQIHFFFMDAREGPTRTLRLAVEAATAELRLREFGLTEHEIAAVTSPLEIMPVLVNKDGEVSVAMMVVPMVFGVFLFIAAMFSGQILMQSVIKEKKNRIVEILLSSVSAMDLLVGKILGYGILGLVQIAIWMLVGLAVASRYLDLKLFFADPSVLLQPLMFFLLGYLMLATLFASLGAVMKDAESGSQSHGLIIMLPMLPIFFAGLIVMNPFSTIARALSFIPPFIPATMLLRIGTASLPLWEVATSLAILMLFVVFMLLAAAKVFSGGILHFQRDLSIKEVARLLFSRD